MGHLEQRSHDQRNFLITKSLPRKIAENRGKPFAKRKVFAEIGNIGSDSMIAKGFRRAPGQSL
jgi:hypothetical protein